MTSCTWITGDTRAVVEQIPDGSIDLVLTSPPFLALRSYLPADHPDKAAEIGSEPTPAEFIDTLLGLTAEWRRVLAPHGSICIELGDTYSGSGGGGGDYLEGGMREGQQQFAGSAASMRESNAAHWRQKNANKDAWPLDKSLTLVPELYRLGLAYGINALTGQESPAGRWRVRNNIRWVRPNPPVGALGDKFRPATSDMVVACVAKDRWFDLDAVRTPLTEPGKEQAQHRRQPERGGERETNDVIKQNPAGAPPLDWWSISPGGYSGSHYAVFPPELLVRPIEAMCPRRVCRTCGTPSRRETSAGYVGRDGGEVATFHMRDGARRADGVNQWDEGSTGDRTVHKTVTTTGWTTCGCPGTDGTRIDGHHTGTGWRPGRVLDPFGGSGTTGLVATGHGRDAILIDLDDRNLDLAHERLGFMLAEATVDELAGLLTAQAVEPAA